ncbi:MAG: hypothetical protein L0Z62_47065, partial [Gemmataceae bacterium]|nr:hypothetical protein [Gemmataceae bacterium]
ANHLRTQLGPDWRVTPWPFDWTLSARVSGHQLARRILADAPAHPDGAYLVCHSFGGLVARVAWRTLGEGAVQVPAGSQGHVRRIVTLGTPHLGSYDPAGVWTERENDVLNLVVLKLGVGPVPKLPGSGSIFRAQVLLVYETIASWPSGVELLRFNQPTDAADPFRAILYDAHTWAPALAPPSQTLLTYARDDWQAWMNAPAAMPPADVLVCVAGEGIQTRTRVQLGGRRTPAWIEWATSLVPGLHLDRAVRQSQLPTFSTSDQGDGRVALDSALVPGRRQLVVQGEHGRLQDHPTILARVVEWLTEAPAPAPQPERPAGPPHPLWEHVGPLGAGQPLPSGCVARRQ